MTKTNKQINKRKRKEKKKKKKKKVTQIIEHQVME